MLDDVRIVVSLYGCYVAMEEEEENQSKMSEKNRLLLKECAEILKDPKVFEWYSLNMVNKNQGDTVNHLLQGVEEGHLTVRQALLIALLVGFQWSVDFEKDA